MIALVSPHAGLRYSGPVAAYGYRLLRGRSPLTVVLVGPSHRAAFDGVAVQAHGAWETPLGRVPIDEEIAGALLDAGAGILEHPDVHRDEHSLEMQMPFLQRLVLDLRIVPAMMGSQSRHEVDSLAEALASALAGRDDAIMVASSDLSHYQPAPVANEQDSVVVEQVGRLDAAGLMDRLETHENVACGGGPVVAVMKAAQSTRRRPGDDPQVRGQRRRGGAGQDSRRRLPFRGPDGFVVSVSEEGPTPAGGELSAEERAELLRVARRSTRGASSPEVVRFGPEATSPTLGENRGAFVTLHRARGGDLRGCVGMMRSEESLVRTVARMAVAAATEDGRFDAVTAAELPELNLEISALGPLVPIRPEEVEVGRHGLLISHRGCRGVLLPQVPVEHGWDRETFLEHTCVKAGLLPETWKEEGVELLSFTAEVFGEEDEG